MWHHSDSKPGFGFVFCSLFLFWQMLRMPVVAARVLLNQHFCVWRMHEWNVGVLTFTKQLGVCFSTCITIALTFMLLHLAEHGNIAALVIVLVLAGSTGHWMCCVLQAPNKPRPWKLLCPAQPLILGTPQRKRSFTGKSSFLPSWLGPRADLESKLLNPGVRNH